MSQTPRVPRIYVNLIEYLKTMGFIDTDDTVYNLNPTKEHLSEQRSIDVPDNIFNNKSFVAFLGHKKGALNLNFDLTTDVSVNVGAGNNIDPEHEGFSIASFDGTAAETINTYTDNSIGSIMLGNYWEAPHAVDLSATLNYDMDGVKTVQTKGGSTLSNASYLKSADWWNGGAWQLGSATNIRGGRRSWSLNFSFLSEDNIFPKVASASNLENTTYEDIFNPTDNTLYDSTDFFTQVWNRTLGPHHEFVLQVDKDDFSPDAFAICRFQQNSLKITQQSPLLYSCSLKIRESW